MLMTSKHTVRELIAELVRARISVAGEYSSNTIASYKEIIEEAKAYASDLDVPWDNDIIPEHVLELIEADREFWESLNE